MDSLTALTRDKVNRFSERLQSVRHDPFIAPDTESALGAIESIFSKHRRTLDDLEKGRHTPEVIANHCDQILEALFTYLPFVGFLHRANHASNPFEVHGPLKRLASNAIGGGVRLIISSEWEYSPHTHPQMGDNEDFVLLGLPASEADNSLLLPIAGHEFGHPVWDRKDLGTKYKERLKRSVYDRLRRRMRSVTRERPDITSAKQLRSEPRAIQWWGVAVDVALRRCEELFCDAFGLWVFGESYCYAFRELLSPGLVGLQSAWYPSARTRAEVMVSAARSYGISIPGGLAEGFIAIPQSSNLLVKVAEAAVLDQMDDLHFDARNAAQKNGVRLPSKTGRRRAATALRLATPAPQDVSFAELLCAAWELKLDTALWSSSPYLVFNRGRTLNELVLKSAQIQDYWFRPSGDSDVK